MKNVLVVFAFVFLGITAVSAQEYKPFKLGLGIGYTMPKGGGGILFDIEPAYRINDQIAVGLRIESAVMAKSIDGEEASASANGSYTLNGQYYLSDAKFRPYVGLGVGLFSLASVSVSSTSGEVAAGSELGFYPRIGFDLGHFNVNLDYNIISSSKADISTSGEDIEIKNSYLGIRIGAFIFGGKN